MSIEQKEYQTSQEILHEQNLKTGEFLAKRLNDLPPEEIKKLVEPVQHTVEKKLEQQIVEKVSKTFEKINKLLKTPEEKQQLQELKDKLISPEGEIINQENFQKFVDSYVKPGASGKIFDIDQAVMKDGILYCHDVDKQRKMIKTRALNEGGITQVTGLKVARPDMGGNKNFEFKDETIDEFVPKKIIEKNIPTEECPPLINLNIVDNYYNLELGYEYQTPDPIITAEDINNKLAIRIDEFNNGKVLKDYESKNPKDVSHKIQFKEKFTGRDRAKDRESFKKFSDEYNKQVDWIKNVRKNRIEADSLKILPPSIQLQK